MHCGYGSKAKRWRAISAVPRDAAICASRGVFVRQRRDLAISAPRAYSRAWRATQHSFFTVGPRLNMPVQVLVTRSSAKQSESRSRVDARNGAAAPSSATALARAASALHFTVTAPARGPRARPISWMDPHAPPPAPGSRRRTATWVRVLLAIVMVPVALLVGEGALRLYRAATGTPYDAHATEMTVRVLVSAMTSAIPDPEADLMAQVEANHVLQPYLGIDQEREIESAEGELWAFRGHKTKDSYVVLIVGGSVAAQTWGQQANAIAQRLSADPRFANRSVAVLGQGRGAFKQPQQVMLLGYLYALGWRPDAVVNIDGFNELALAWDNASLGVHPAYPSYWSWGLLAKTRANRSDELRRAARILALADRGRELGSQMLDRGWQHSAILGEYELGRLRAVQSEWAEAQRDFQKFIAPAGEHDTSRGPHFQFDEQATFERVVRLWVESSVSLDGLVRAHDGLYVHVLQPTLHDAGSKPLTQDEIASGAGQPLWDAAIARGYPQLRAAGPELTRRGVHFADLSQIFQDLEERTYVDGCHFQGAGMTRFGERIVAALLAALPAELPPPLTPRAGAADAAPRRDH